VTIRSIVVGIDGSETAYRAFAMAVGLAVRERGCVHACYVAHVPGIAAVGGFVPLTPLLDDRLDDDLAHFVTEELSRAHVDGDFTWRSGAIAAELELLAADCKADLVVMGAPPTPASISAASRDNYSLGGAAQSSSCPNWFEARWTPLIGSVEFL
jgi:nucleotide-binding universal stress UspA family protein